MSPVDGQSGFLHENVTVGMAWDYAEGALFFSLDGSSFVKIPFPDPVVPDLVVGAALYPVFSGRGGCKVKYNMGDNQRKFLHAPPTPDYISCAQAQQLQVKYVCS